MYKKLYIFLIFSLISFISFANQNIDLSGEWDITLTGNTRSRLCLNKASWGKISLPSSIQLAGFGESPSKKTKWTAWNRGNSWTRHPIITKWANSDEYKQAFWLQPEKVYTGYSWFSKKIEIPADWKDSEIILELERVKWESTLWLNGRLLGRQESLCTPHRYNIEKLISPGENTILIRVSNREVFPVGINSHSVSDHTQGDWNGIIGKISIEKKAKTNISNFQIFTEIDPMSITAKTEIKTTSVANQNFSIILKVKDSEENIISQEKYNFSTNKKNSNFEFTLNGLKKCTLWDEFNPILYTLEAIIMDGEQEIDKVEHKFGFREIKVEGKKILINGNQAFFRGTLDCAAFPLTGHVPMDKESWIKILSTIKNAGLNHVRYHSWCPPKVAFEVADELGLYLQVEGPTWAAFPQSLGNLRLQRFLERENKRIFKEYGNHPSFTMFVYGNEPGGAYHVWLNRQVKEWKAEDSRRIYSGASGWPELSENEFFVALEPRIQRWGEGLNSVLNVNYPSTKLNYDSYVENSPVALISHEIGQWCAYPNFDEIDKYTGFMKAKNFEIYREIMQEQKILHKAEDFLHASGKLQIQSYKADIEAALLTEDFGGFQLLGLSDFPGQGTALVGVLDAFWDTKPYFSYEEFRKFCNSVVPLAVMDKLIYEKGERIKAEIKIAQFSDKDINSKIKWSLFSDKKEIKSGVLEQEFLPKAKLSSFGMIELETEDLLAGEYKLEIKIEGTEFKNDWSIWIFDKKDKETIENSTIHIADKLDNQLWDRLNNGESVILLANPANVKTPVSSGFAPNFWNSAWTNGQKPDTLGIQCDPQHTIFNRFKNEGFSSYMWWELVHNGATLDISGLTEKVSTIVYGIDTWFRATPSAYLIETGVGKGRIIISSFNLSREETRPAARAFLADLVEYAATQPAQQLPQLKRTEIEQLFK
ncbi:MAG: hypothetical protein JXR63_07030 [Spirochaetales bacterium]|nr:hypothetical protein [Spirochaetales bacterium]